MAGRDQEPGPPEGGGRAPLFLAGARQQPRRFIGHLHNGKGQKKKIEQTIEQKWKF